MVVLLAWLAFISIPITLGGIGLSWDALNHHVYLGWTAERPRFDLDFLAASYQSYQYPYLYWPVYRLVEAGLSGVFAGIVLATLHVIAVPPVWIIARVCMPDRTAFAMFMRLAAVALAFSTGVVLSLFDSTSNDLLAAAPLVWGIAFALLTLEGDGARSTGIRQLLALSGLCVGVSVAFKLSNGPLAIVFPVLWAFSPPAGKRLGNVAIAMLASGVGFAFAYGPWGWQLWSHFGNPVYPFCDDWFAIVRSWLGRST